MIISTGTLVAVVDGEKLALFHNTGHQSISLTPVATPEVAERASGAAGRGSSGANPDNDTQAEDGFALGVADVLNKMVLNHKVEHLLVIAAPKTMGQLRKGWHKETGSRIVGEIAKDLTGHSPDQIAAAIEKA
ncbi:MAG: host attachment family protein [Brevundimonas sp.]|uniref:host attachment family protein n=1 Tax=Brevundimonas sp. TaxID=1871086 RepID=UPI002722661C|nr:host attachment family protein [Brevundimonas sp.]MDO9588084.1 host attachment family protein [Brevundimonas sp.]MDP3369631.1 host attachment family protein [Brevundimonas sp.]MDP3657316.1 host attachment family protein [Brevundimonas sp.]MDZ4111621.1 host attachment family protein [Brevundimonas sp.]